MLLCNLLVDEKNSGMVVFIEKHSNKSFLRTKTTISLQLLLCLELAVFMKVKSACFSATHAANFARDKTLSLPHLINFYLKKHHHTFFMWLEKTRKAKSTSASIKNEANMKSVAKVPRKADFLWCLSRFFPQISLSFLLAVLYTNEELSSYLDFWTLKIPKHKIQNIYTRKQKTKIMTGNRTIKIKNLLYCMQYISQ